MEKKDCYEVIVKLVDGTILHEQTYPPESIMCVMKKTYPKDLEGWCRSELLFNNLTEEKECVRTSYHSESFKQENDAMEVNTKTPKRLNEEGFDITKEQYDELAIVDLMCGCNCSVYEVLKILKIMKLI